MGASKNCNMGPVGPVSIHDTMGIKLLYKLKQIWSSTEYGTNEVLGCLFNNFGTNMDTELFADVTCKELSLFYHMSMDVQKDFTLVRVLSLNLERGSYLGKMVSL